MGELNINNAVASDLTNAVDDYSVDTSTTDGATDQKETEWQNANWGQWLGYYRKIPELSSVIDAKATWTVGKGYKTDPQTTFILESIRGFGKDTFNTILENMIRTYNIGGDGFCEIIRDDEGNLVNLKPLNPGSIKIIANKQGIITRYEQTSPSKDTPKKFNPEEIFHLPRNRVADEFHGQSITEKLVDIILMKNEAMADYKKVMHYFVKPRWIIKLDTDDPVKIAEFKTKMDNANADGENMYIPMNSVELEPMAIAPNSTLNPLSWIESLDAKFYEAAQVPKIIVGGSGGFTEAAVKIAYLAFQQTIEEEQLFIEEQVGLQLGMAINLEFPASLENELISDNNKDAENGATQPNDTEAGSGQ